jgi:hypothetical protein
MLTGEFSVDDGEDGKLNRLTGVSDAPQPLSELETG